MKRGQISVFIIIGLVFIVLLFLVTQMSTFRTVQDDYSVVRNFDTSANMIVYTCLENIINDRIDGGFQFLPVQVMNDLPSCVRPSLDAEFGDPKVSVYVADSQLEIDVNFPIAITTEQSTTRHSDFYLSYPTFSAIDTSQTILNSPDGKVTLRLDPGTVITDLNGDGIGKLQLHIKESYMPNNLDNVVYVIGPDVKFSKPAMLSFKYDIEELSGIVVGDGLNLQKPEQFSLRMLKENDLSIAELVPLVEVDDNIYTNQKLLTSSVIKSQKTVTTSIKQGGIFLLVPNKLHIATIERSLFTTNSMDMASALSIGYEDLGVVGYLKSSGDLPVYSFDTGPYNNNYLTTNKHELNLLKNAFEAKGIVGYLDDNPGPGKTALYRLNNYIADYQYSTSSVEKDKALNYLNSMLAQLMSSADISTVIIGLDNREDTLGMIDHIDMSLDNIDIDAIDFQPYFYDGLMGYIQTMPSPGRTPLHHLYYSQQFVSVPYQNSIYTSWTNPSTIMPITGLVLEGEIQSGMNYGGKGYSIGNALTTQSISPSLAISLATLAMNKGSAYAMEHTEPGTFAHAVATGVNAVTGAVLGVIGAIMGVIAGIIGGILGAIADALGIGEDAGELGEDAPGGTPGDGDVDNAVDGDGGVGSGGGLGSAGGDAGCFLPGTNIATEHGTINIELIKKGDRVLSYNELLGETEIQEVKKILVHPHDGTYLIINNELSVTPNHRMLINRQWRQIAEAKLGDTLLDKEGNEIIIFSIEKAYSISNIYNLEIEENHNYFAEGILVHNMK